MKKIHIALVGGQTAPVYQGIIDSNSDFVILIHSMQTKDEANRIQSEINFKSELREIDPVDLPSIIAEANLLFEKYSNSELISVNITSGTKLWALIFYKVFAPLKTATIFYIDQNAKVWNLTDEETHNIDFEIDTQFRLYGNPLKKYKLISEFDETDFNMIEKIKQLRKSNYIDFFALTEYLSNKNGISEHKIASGSWVKWDKEDKAYIGVLKNKYGDNAFELKSKNIKTLFLNTGWFELEIAHIFSRWKLAKEIRIKCIFPTKNGSPKNEIDIIINTGNKLLFIECKTQINKVTDIDKFASAVKVYGGGGSKAIFITESPMDEKSIEKCNDNKILHFSIYKPDRNLNGENKLFKMIENELFNINSK